MKTSLWVIPKPSELRTLPMRNKDSARGLVAWCVFTFLRIGRWFGWRWATTTYERFVQCVGGVVYFEGTPPSKSLQGHEAVHDWQHRTLGTPRYLWRYYATRDGRRHAEAMAYGYEVAIHGRDAEERATSASDPVYAMAWSRAEARVLIDLYASAFRASWPNPARWE